MGLALTDDAERAVGANADAIEAAGVVIAADAGGTEPKELAEAASAPEVPEALIAAASRPLSALLASGAASTLPARVVHCAVLCSMERSVSLIRSGAGGGPAGLAGTRADAVVAAKKESLDMLGGTDLPRTGFIGLLREAACETLEEAGARTAAGALRFSDERDTSIRRDAEASTERLVPHVVDVWAAFGGTVTAAFATRATPAAPDPAPSALFTPAALSRVPCDIADAAPVFSQPAGAMGSIGSRNPAP